MSELRELIERWRRDAQICHGMENHQRAGALSTCADDLLAALDAAEVPTQPEVCRWGCALMANSIKTACGQKADAQMLAQAMSYGGGDCPDCGRKIEVCDG